MKTITLTFAISLIFSFQSIGQINPVQNLSWSHGYDYPHNLFVLEWDEPAQPHDEIIGYNIYREDDFYLFITGETSIYNIDNTVYGIVSNCGGVDFLLYNDGEGFLAHVTAVYNGGSEESIYTETVYVNGPALGINDIEEDKLMLYPNPTDGKLNIEMQQLNKIEIYDLSGKRIKEFEPQSQIDLSQFPKGLYMIKLFLDKRILVDKIVIE